MENQESVNSSGQNLAMEEVLTAHDTAEESARVHQELDAEKEQDTARAEQDNIRAFDELINAMRVNTLTKRDAGTRFETLIQDWLRLDAAYSDLFTAVLTYKDWAKHHPELTSSARDTGIDLVGVNAGGDGYTAIQCKLYQKDRQVSKADIDSFISASDKKYFTRRLLIATNTDWSPNVLTDLRSKTVPVEVISYDKLAHSNVNWAAYTQGEKALMPVRRLRGYQKECIDKVLKGFETADRGKLIMACGTGKTFTSMKLVEQLAAQQADCRSFVLFLVPSLSLLSQTLTDWKRNCALAITAFAVCSDSTTGKVDGHDPDNLTKVDELAYPATTQADKLYKEVTKALNEQPQNHLTVIFSTYQSIAVIHEAQQLGMAEFDLIISDEAHRTCGISYSDDLTDDGLEADSAAGAGKADTAADGTGKDSEREESYFILVHDNEFIRSRKRLYMTATPKIYGEEARIQAAKDAGLQIYSMDDEKIYGKTFATISFTQAIDLHCLVDYKVIVMSISESVFTEDNELFTQIEAMSGLSVNNATRIIGLWRALTKLDFKEEQGTGKNPMKRAVAFAQCIERSDKPHVSSSKVFTAYCAEVIDAYKQREKAFLQKELGDKFDEQEYAQTHGLQIEARHIDGSMNAVQKDELLSWLREEPAEDQCRMLFNVRCLSEGVDVPALDAVAFLSARRSVVDIVQTVGRVMRTAPGKERGYVILPVVVPSGVEPSYILEHNQKFEVVWKVLNALKSIDSTFGRAVDVENCRINPERIEVIAVSHDKIKPKGKKAGGGSGRKKPGEDDYKEPIQTMLELERDRYFEFEEELKTRIVKRVGNRMKWEDWVEDVGEICQTQINHIKKIVQKDPSSRQALNEFKAELGRTLNGEPDDDAVIEMLGQHVIIKPVLDALFDAYPFAEQNPISRAMTQVLDKLDKQAMKACRKLLEPFYGDVKRLLSAQTGKDELGRQTFIKEVFDNFFKKAFPRMQDKLGIVYTPLEIVDFMNKSAAWLLEKEFGRSINEPGLHILDPFTGTGSYIVRLIQSGLIDEEHLKYKYEHDLHAHEIVPLAYYIAALNIETAYHAVMQTDQDYKPNDVLLWTDTFAAHPANDLFQSALQLNNQKLQKELGTDIQVIIGNPPYSVGQASQNDNT